MQWGLSKLLTKKSYNAAQNVDLPVPGAPKRITPNLVFIDSYVSSDYFIFI